MTEINVLQASAKDASKIGKIAYQVAQIHYQQTNKELRSPHLKVKQSILQVVLPIKIFWC